MTYSVSTAVPPGEQRGENRAGVERGAILASSEGNMWDS